MTLPEVVLWQSLRGGKQGGFKFRRQHPIGPFVLDFFCARMRLAVEVDGATHHTSASNAHDIERDAWLGDQGVQVLRIPASLILNDLDAALQRIGQACSGEG